MENNNSSSEILKEFARKSGRNIEYLKNPYDEEQNHWVRRVCHHRKIYIPNSTGDISYFVSFAAARSLNLNSEDVLFSGVFIPIQLPAAVNICIQKKDILDKLNIFNKNKFLKSGFEHFDARVAIKGNDPFTARKTLTSRKVREEILAAFELDESFIAGVNTVEADFVPALKNNSIFGIYSINGWILEEEKIENLFNALENIKPYLYPPLKT